MEGSIIIIIILRQYKIILNFPTIKNSLIGVGYRIIETEGQKKKKTTQEGCDYLDRDTAIPMNRREHVIVANRKNCN